MAGYVRQGSVRTRGVLVLLAAVGLNLLLGVHYAWSLLAKSLGGAPTFWTNQEAAAPFTVASFVFPLAMLLAGLLQKRLGARRLVLLGVFVSGAGLLLSSFVRSPFLLALVYGLLMGGGMGLGYSSLIPVVMGWFSPAAKGLVAGLVVGGFGFASLYAAPLAGFLSSRLGVFGALRLFGAGLFLLGVPLALSVRETEVAPSPSLTDSLSPSSGSVVVSSWKKVVSGRGYWILWVQVALSVFSGLLVLGNLAKVAFLQGGLLMRRVW